MTMRKKDYEAIARVFRDALVVWRNSGQPEHALTLTAQALASQALAPQDPTFKRERFLADCGVSHD